MIAILLAAIPRLCASEYGVTTYRSGLMDVYAGVVPPPGTLMLKDQFFFQPANNTSVTNNGRIKANTNTNLYANALFLGYVTPFSILGAHYAVGTLQLGIIAQQAARIGPVGLKLPQQHLTIGELGDGIFFPAILGWNFGRLHLMTAFGFYAPTGNYEKDRIVNTGLNRWAFEPDLGLTWLDDLGHEASIFAGYTINMTNTATNYSSGNEFHLDFAFVKHFADGLMFGTAGYALQQITADSGSGAAFGAYKNRVVAFGPIAGYRLPISESKAIDFAFKYDFECATQNRLSGNELWFTATFHL